MPVACSTQALTGQEGAVQFKPAGTSFCLLDFTDFPDGTSITVPSNHDYQIGDPVVFKAEGTAVLNTSLTDGTTYYVVATSASSIDVSADSGGTAITLTQANGGTGSEDTPGAENHISIAFADWATICQTREVSIEISREELDVTTLPCTVGASGGKYASFRKMQSGYATGSGTMTVYFTDDQTAISNRLLSNTMLKSQMGAEVKIYVNAVGDGAGAIDKDKSLFIESGISITGMSFGINPDDPTTAELSFNINNPKNILGAQLV